MKGVAVKVNVHVNVNCRFPSASTMPSFLTDFFSTLDLKTLFKFALHAALIRTTGRKSNFGNSPYSRARVKETKQADTGNSRHANAAKAASRFKQVESEDEDAEGGISERDERSGRERDEACNSPVKNGRRIHNEVLVNLLV